MRVKAEKEKAEAAATKKALAEIDKAAAAQYERDRAAAEAARRALGSWVSVLVARKREKRAFFAVFVAKNIKKKNTVVDTHPSPFSSLSFKKKKNNSQTTQDEDESGHLYNATLRYYYNK